LPILDGLVTVGISIVSTVESWPSATVTPSGTHQILIGADCDSTLNESKIEISRRILQHSKISR
jgi:hypothetical protein